MTTELRASIDVALAAALSTITDDDGFGTVPPVPASLRDALAYILLAPGKRARPTLTLAMATALAPPGEPAESLAMPAAVAVEMVHAYSLVHDDLPALDNDDLRRGRPTAHKAFGEALAILAGDALLTHAFAVLASAPRHGSEQVRELAVAAGPIGMVAGQVEDMAAEGKPITVDALRAIHRRKTGRLFASAAALGAIAVGADAVKVRAARRFGAALGFAFQVQDDVIDVTGDVVEAGKALGRDLAHDKATYVRLLGLEDAKALAQQAGDDARDALVSLAVGAERLTVLRGLVDAAVVRRG
jgi:geranylgeranyl diphosphate synthase, type II